MKYIRLNVISILWLISTNLTLGQAISAGFGPIFTLTKANPAVVNAKSDFSNTAYQTNFMYEHFFSEKKYSVFAEYSEFEGCTFMLFQEGGWITPGESIILGVGFCAGLTIKRYDIGIAYSLLKRNRKFYLKPFFALGLQNSKTTGVEYWNDGEPINGPDYFELEPRIAEPLNTSQIVPSLGFRTGFVFWKRLDIGLSLQGVYGFKLYQKMELKYHYKGVVQPTAKYEATGTGVYITLGIGYRFARWIK